MKTEKIHTNLHPPKKSSECRDDIQYEESRKSKECTRSQSQRGFGSHTRKHQAITQGSLWKQIIGVFFSQKTHLVLFVCLLAAPVLGILAAGKPYEQPAACWNGQQVSTDQNAVLTKQWEKERSGEIDASWIQERKAELAAAERSKGACSVDGAVQITESLYYSGVWAMNQDGLDPDALPDQMAADYQKARWIYGNENRERSWMTALSYLAMSTIFLMSLLFGDLCSEENNWAGGELLASSPAVTQLPWIKLAMGFMLAFFVLLIQTVLFLGFGRLWIGDFPQPISVLFNRTMQPLDWQVLFRQAFLIFWMASLQSMLIGYLCSLMIKKPVISVVSSLAFSLLPLWAGFLPGWLMVMHGFSHVSFMALIGLVAKPYIIMESCVAYRTVPLAAGLSLVLWLALGASWLKGSGWHARRRSKKAGRKMPMQTLKI